MILRVGLTGGIASGKSTVRRLFASFGCFTIDADELVAQLYQPGRAGHAALVATYGGAIVRDDETIDRVALANAAFATPDDARKLNALIHPIVLRETAQLLDDYERTHGDNVAIVEATLLLEAGGRARYDRIVVVDVPVDVQLERGVARGLSREEVARRIAHQMPREERARHADYVIDNGGDAAALERATRGVYDALVAELREKTKAPDSRPGPSKNESTRD
ncbi:MAG: dephospho-CoA kinase [Acidobacteria bacterium]|nr:dephospho-CoA kinase [Acidobacteriota bacterium]